MADYNLVLDKHWLNLNKEEIQDKLQRALDLPDYYGKNLDALYDCLSEANTSISVFFYEELLQNDYLSKLYNLFKLLQHMDKNIYIHIIPKSIMDSCSLPSSIISKRFSCRNFSDCELPTAILDNMEKYILNAPTALNKQELNIRLITNQELLLDLSSSVMSNIDDEAKNRMKSRGASSIFYNAPALYLISSDKANVYSDINSGILAQTIAVGATLEGLSSCIIGMVRLSNLSDFKLRERLMLSSDEKIIISVAIGYKHDELTNISPHEPQKSIIKIK